MQNSVQENKTCRSEQLWEVWVVLADLVSSPSKAVAVPNTHAGGAEELVYASHVQVGVRLAFGADIVSMVTELVDMVESGARINVIARAFGQSVSFSMFSGRILRGFLISVM